MTFTEFDDSMDVLLADCLKMKSGKGKEYANSEDRLANFKEIGASLGISPAAVCMIYLEKHMRSIKSYVRTQEALSEPIRGRIVDAITYLALLNGIIEEENTQRHQSVCQHNQTFQGVCTACKADFRNAQGFPKC